MRKRLRPVCIYVLTIISVKILHKCDETSLTVTRNVVSLTVKRQVAITMHTTPHAGFVVEVTFQSHCNSYDLFSNTTRLSSSLFNSGENNIIF